MNPISRLLTRPVTSTRADSTFASIAAYIAALLVLGIGFTGIGMMDATQMEIFLATLGVATLCLLLGTFGLLIEIQQRLRGLSQIESAPGARS